MAPPAPRDVVRPLGYCWRIGATAGMLMLSSLPPGVPRMDTATLQATAQQLINPDKSILAADESEGTIGRRFDAVGIPNTEDNRRTYRELFFTTPGIARLLSGVILF